MANFRHIGYEISKTSKQIRRIVDSRINKSDLNKLTGTHGWAIGYFCENSDRDIFQKDFERQFNIRRSTASNILRLMEENGLIKRESVPQDARLKKIILTKKALNIHNSVVDSFDKLEDTMRQDISEEELETFFTVLDKINFNLERNEEANDKKAD